MADSISAIPQQPQLGRLAQFLRYLETQNRPEFLPRQLDVMGLMAKLALPQASTVENLSYGNLPFTMPPSGTGAMIPQVKTGRKPEVADLIATFSGVPGMGAVADVGAKLSNTAADQLVRMITRNPQATAPQILQETAMPFMQAVAPKTNAFKNWFEGSKLVDESGNPMIVYHGSGSKDIQEFDVSKYETVQRGDWGEGIYFTPSKWLADGYRKTAVQRGDKSIQEAFDAIETKAKEFGTSGMDKWLDLRAGKITQDQYNELNRLEEVWRTKLKEAESPDKGAVYPAYLNLKNPYVYTYGGITEPDLAKIAKKQRHDGIIIKSEDGAIEEIVVFDPKQIKSADKNVGTFDPNTANIYRGAIASPIGGLLGGDEGE